MSVSDVAAVKRFYRLDEVAQQHTKLVPSGVNRLKGLCPFHVEKTASFMIDVAQGLWHCHGCHAGGDVIDFFGWVQFGHQWNSRDKEMFKTVLRQLPAPYPVAPRLARPPAENKTSVSPRDALEMIERIATLCQHTLHSNKDVPESAWDYLRARGLSDETITRERLGYAEGDEIVRFIKRGGAGMVALAREMCLLKPTEDKHDRAFLNKRIIFPTLDAARRAVHLSGRSFPMMPDEKRPKYLHLTGIDKPLCGFASLEMDTEQPVLIVESPPDRLTLLQWGYDALSTLGTYLSPLAGRQLMQCRRPVVFVPHNDDNGAGMAAAIRWRTDLGKGRICQLPPDVKDVNDLAKLVAGSAIFARILGSSVISCNAV